MTVTILHDITCTNHKIIHVCAIEIFSQVLVNGKKAIERSYKLSLNERPRLFIPEDYDHDHRDRLLPDTDGVMDEGDQRGI
jgi:hypothetical protein